MNTNTCNDNNYHPTILRLVGYILRKVRTELLDQNPTHIIPDLVAPEEDQNRVEKKL